MEGNEDDVVGENIGLFRPPFHPLIPPLAKFGEFGVEKWAEGVHLRKPILPSSLRQEVHVYVYYLNNKYIFINKYSF